jgi:hypothetical protein
MVQGFGRCAAGGCDLIPKFRHVFPGSLREFDGTSHRLKDQLGSHSPRKTHMNTGVDHRLHQQENICRSGAAEGGSHIKIIFIINIQLLA